jgi:RNA polymerase sigma-70 factor (ECF subfamily)
VSVQGGAQKGAGDEQLMQAVAEGDLDAFEEIVLRYRQHAWSTAYRFLGDAMDAEDVAQEAFLKILEASPRYRPTATFRTYLYHVLTRLCIDRIRKNQPALADDLSNVPDSSISPAEQLMEREQGKQVCEALDTLPPNQKAAIILRHYEGLSYKEIARVLSVTPKSVERLISRARTALQSRLAHVIKN